MLNATGGLAGIPKMVVEDFSKELDPAYLRNGMIENRPGSNPIEVARSQVGGLVVMDQAACIFAHDGIMQRMDPSTTKAGLTRTYLTKVVGGDPLRCQTIAAMVSDVYHPEPEHEAIRLANWGGLLGNDEPRAKNREA